MSDADFDSLLSQDMGDVEAPKPLPAGDYILTIKSYEMVKSSRKGTPGITFYFRPTEAGEDVDTEQLEEMGNWKEKNLRSSFWLTENSMFMIRRFLEEACGLDVEGHSLKELLPETVGQQVRGTVTQQHGDNGSFNPDVERLTAVD